MSTEKNRVIELVGMFPPPYGGVSVHLMRLSSALSREGYQCKNHHAYPRDGPGNLLSRLSPALYRFLNFSLSFRGGVVHLHEPGWKLLLQLWILSRIRKTRFVVTIHGFDKNWPWLINDPSNPNDPGDEEEWRKKRGRVGNILFMIARRALSSADKVTVVSKSLGQAMLRMGINPNKILLVSPFIPSEDRETDLPPHIQSFVSSHDPVILTFAAIRLMDGIDVYGVDMALEAFKTVKNKYPDAGLIATISWVDDSHTDYFENIKSETVKAGLGEDVLFTESVPNPNPLYESATIFLRPTCTDGDSLSVRESQATGIPVVASDCVTRPRGVLLFKNRDVESFNQAIERALSPKTKKKKYAERSVYNQEWKRLLQAYE